MISADVVEQIDEIWNLNEEELYRRLGMASLGTENALEAAGSMQFLIAVAANTDAMAARHFLSENLLTRGQTFFNRLWSSAKEIICTTYHEGHRVGDTKDMAAYLVDILVNAGRIANPLATVVVIIAIRRGLERMCPALPGGLKTAQNSGTHLISGVP